VLVLQNNLKKGKFDDFEYEILLVGAFGLLYSRYDSV